MNRPKSSASAVLWWSLALAFLGLVILAAARPEFNSASTQALIHRLFPALGTQALVTAAYWVRRAVHFLAYLALAVILVNALAAGPRLNARTRLAVGVAAVTIALAVAILDETLQARFPGRLGRARDVALDLAGITAGTMLRLRAMRGNR